MLGELGDVVVSFAAAAALQCFRHGLMEEPAPRATDVAVDDLAHLVVAEIVYAAVGFLAQQAAPGKHLDGIEQLLFGLAGYVEERLEIEASAEHRRSFQ